MLKPPGPPPPSEPDASIGDLIERLFDEAIDYGRAELDLFKAKAQELLESYVRAAILFGIAAILASAGNCHPLRRHRDRACPLARAARRSAVSLLLASASAGLLTWIAFRDLGKEP